MELEQGIADEELRPDSDLKMMGDMIFGAIEGIAWRRILVNKDPYLNIEVFASTFVNKLLHGALVRNHVLRCV